MDLHTVEMINSAGIWAILALSLNVIVGYAGIASIGHAAFYAIGAYSSAIMCVRLGAPPWLGMAVGCVLAAGLGALISIPSLRLRDDYLMLTTLGFGEIVYLTCRNWESLTNGPRGIGGIPTLRVLSVPVTEMGLMPWLIWGCVFTLAGLLWALEHSPFGRQMMAVRDNEIAAMSLGVRPILYKLTAMVVGAMAASFAGSLLAHKLSFIDSEAGFGLSTSVMVFAMVILGGRGSIMGVVAGAILLSAVPEVLRRFGLPLATAAPLRQIIFGILLVAIVVFRPQGLFGKLKFRE